MKQKHRITGMSRTSCAAQVEKAARSVEGVKSAQNDKASRKNQRHVQNDTRQHRLHCLARTTPHHKSIQCKTLSAGK